MSDKHRQTLMGLRLVRPPCSSRITSLATNRSGPLQDVTVAVKDNICTTSMPTTCSSAMLLSKIWVIPISLCRTHRLRCQISRRRLTRLSSKGCRRQVPILWAKQIAMSSEWGEGRSFTQTGTMNVNNTDPSIFIPCTVRLSTHINHPRRLFLGQTANGGLLAAARVGVQRQWPQVCVMRE